MILSGPHLWLKVDRKERSEMRGTTIVVVRVNEGDSSEDVECRRRLVVQQLASLPEVTGTSFFEPVGVSQNVIREGAALIIDWRLNDSGDLERYFEFEARLICSCPDLDYILSGVVEERF